jgi:hypothetical protein
METMSVRNAKIAERIVVLYASVRYRTCASEAMALPFFCQEEDRACRNREKEKDDIITARNVQRPGKKWDITSKNFRL